MLVILVELESKLGKTFPSCGVEPALPHGRGVGGSGGSPYRHQQGVMGPRLGSCLRSGCGWGGPGEPVAQASSFPRLFPCSLCWTCRVLGSITISNCRDVFLFQIQGDSNFRIPASGAFGDFML